MDEIQKIKNTELNGLLSEEREEIRIGDYLTDSRQEELIYVYDVEERKDNKGGTYRMFKVRYLNPITFEARNYFGRSEDTKSEENIRKYYRRLNTSDIQRTRNLAQRVLNGEQFEFNESSEENALLDISSKQTLLALQENIKEQRAIVESTMKYCKLIHSQMMREIENKISAVEEIRDKMNREIDKLTYVITTIETYAGIKEEIITLRDGEPASADVPLVVRQAVVFMDEELALLYDGFDWQKAEFFDKWLIEDDHFKTLMPEEKSIVAIRPRRTDKQYATNDDVYNFLMNRPNKKIMFLIRNGERLYRIDSEHISLKDRMFPNPNEYSDRLKYEAVPRSSFVGKEGDRESDRMRKRYTQVAFLLQGLIERSDVFAPHNIQCSFLKMTGIDGKSVIMSYELDTERQLTNGRPDIQTWIKELNSKLCEGKRIILVPSSKWNNDYVGYNFSNNDFKKFYYSEYTQPNFPYSGVYSLVYDEESHGDWLSAKKKHYLIKYLPSNETYSWTDGFKSRKNKVTIFIDIERSGILNYDDLNIEELDYYLNCRLYRSCYFKYVKLLKIAKDILKEERAREDEFKMMMLGEIMHEGLEGVNGVNSEKEAIDDALETIKSRLKWKRPISSNEKETYYLVRKTLFSAAFKKKYFKKLDA